MTTDRHPKSLRLVHWTTAALVLVMLALGLSMVDSLAPWRTTGLAVHKVGGLIVLTLTLIRVVLRVRHRPPPLPATMEHSQRVAAALVHAALYVLLLAVPLSGWAMQGAAGTPVQVFGIGLLPQIVPESLVLYGVLRETHGLLATALLLCIFMHLAGALHDGLVSRGGLFQRMLK